MERRAAFLEHLRTRDFSAVETAGNLHLHALGACTHRGGDGHLDGAAVSHLAFDLAGDARGNNLRVQLGTLYLIDIDLDILVRDFLELFLQFLHFLTARADDEARTGGAYCDGDELECALDDNTRDAALCEAHVQIFAKLVVLENVGGVFALFRPVGVPTANYAQAVADRIYFLSHKCD